MARALFLLAVCLALAGCATVAPPVAPSAPEAEDEERAERSWRGGPFFTKVRVTPERPEPGTLVTLSARAAMDEGPLAHGFGCVASQLEDGSGGGGILWKSTMTPRGNGVWTCEVPVREEVRGFPAALMAQVDGEWTTTSFFLVTTALEERPGAAPTPFASWTVREEEGALAFRAVLGVPNPVDDATPTRVSADYCTFGAGGGFVCASALLARVDPTTFEARVPIDREAMRRPGGEPVGSVRVIAVAQTINALGGHGFSEPRELVVPP